MTKKQQAQMSDLIDEVCKLRNENSAQDSMINRLREEVNKWRMIADENQIMLEDWKKANADNERLAKNRNQWIIVCIVMFIIYCIGLFLSFYYR